MLQLRTILLGQLHVSDRVFGNDNNNDEQQLLLLCNLDNEHNDDASVSVDEHKDDCGMFVCFDKQNI
jgi:hypothetical protein